VSRDHGRGANASRQSEQFHRTSSLG
jgi:hypothetical protein